ncbi:MAG: hypothetical protein ACOCUS_05380, partial [Polyangiales bacterium]
MARTTVLLLCMLSIGCAGSARPEPRTSPDRLWADHEFSLPESARPFAVGVAESDTVYTTALGSWTEPLEINGIVLDASRGGRGDSVRVRAARWLGTHRLVLGHGSERIVLRYDAPSEPAPVHPGERVHLYAHTMAVGPALSFVMDLRDQRGRHRMIGLRAPSPETALMPEGWSVGYGPELDREPLCGGSLVERAVRIGGPAGEVIVSPGWTSTAAIGEGGTRYAIDVATAREAR